MGSPTFISNRPLILPLDMQMKKLVVDTCDESSFFFSKGRRTACSQVTCYGITGCSLLSIGDRRIMPRLLHWILRLTFGSLWLLFIQTWEPFSKYSPVTLHLSPATRILIKNLGRMNIYSPRDASKGRLELFLGIPKKCFDLVCSTRSDCGNSAIRCE